MLASLAAGMVIAAGLLGPQWHGLTGDPVERAGYWVLVVFASGFTGALGFLPLVIGIAIAEAVKLRSLLVYALAGAGMMLLGYYSAGILNNYEESIDRPPLPISREAEIAAAAGAAFGLVYWAIAGRKAGAWRGA
jgi:hypothetical protein